jgi:hypothetical protein
MFTVLRGVKFALNPDVLDTAMIKMHIADDYASVLVTEFVCATLKFRLVDLNPFLTKGAQIGFKDLGWFGSLMER